MGLPTDLPTDSPTDSPIDSPCTEPHELGPAGPEPGEKPQYRGRITHLVKKSEPPARPNGPPEPQPNLAGRHRGVDHTVVEVFPLNFADHNPPNAPFQD
ncbi:hypothetical protein RHS04_09647 [Rhizoctonia solani]|uniref:Uncharacterized protein n=1 Tax=Rhizoctonia solani TaxID=456999 RepID=A0A8H7GZ92_9AGAM|nr:hypothetical protein RHS04_09647 [Rhizoctonia solani]KAF8754303.1 hypothetical protein RHS01_06440 [Rhizoctonia solani]